MLRNSSIAQPTHNTGVYPPRLGLLGIRVSRDKIAPTYNLHGHGFSSLILLLLLLLQSHPYRSPPLLAMSTSAIPKGSIVLVTGVNGYIASHIADQLLLAGYNVRGSVRDASRTQWIAELFNKKYGPGRFERCVVPNMSVDGAFDVAVKGEPIHIPFTSSV